MASVMGSNKFEESIVSRVRQCLDASYVPDLCYDSKCARLDTRQYGIRNG